MADEAKKGNRGFGGTTRALDMFIASLNWLAYKSIYYSLAAKYLKADTFLHPIRHAYPKTEAPEFRRVTSDWKIPM